MVAVMPAPLFQGDEAVFLEQEQGPASLVVSLGMATVMRSCFEQADRAMAALTANTDAESTDKLFP